MTQPIYFIGLNGPPGAGKDTLAQALMDSTELNNLVLTHHVKFAAPLKDAVHALFGGVYNEERKNQPSPYGPTWRQLYIGMSEDYAKKITENESIFGVLMVERIEAAIKSSNRPTMFICSDCGFEPEQWPVIEHLGADNCLYWNIHRDGHSFASDSRGYIRPVGVPTLDFWNWHESVEDVKASFLEQFLTAIATRWRLK